MHWRIPARLASCSAVFVASRGPTITYCSNTVQLQRHFGGRALRCRLCRAWERPVGPGGDVHPPSLPGPFAVDSHRAAPHDTQLLFHTRRRRVEHGSSGVIRTPRTRRRRRRRRRRRGVARGGDIVPVRGVWRDWEIYGVTRYGSRRSRWSELRHRRGVYSDTTTAGDRKWLQGDRASCWYLVEYRCMGNWCRQIGA